MSAYTVENMEYMHWFACTLRSAKCMLPPNGPRNSGRTDRLYHLILGACSVDVPVSLCALFHRPAQFLNHAMTQLFDLAKSEGKYSTLTWAEGHTMTLGRAYVTLFSTYGITRPKLRGMRLDGFCRVFIDHSIVDHATEIDPAAVQKLLPDWFAQRAERERIPHV